MEHPDYCSERREYRCRVQGSAIDTSISGGLWGITLYISNAFLNTWTFYLFNLLNYLNLFLFRLISWFLYLTISADFLSGYTARF